MAIIKRKLTLDAIDNLFEKYGGIEDIIDASYNGKFSNRPEANFDILFEEDSMRIVATGHYVKPFSSADDPVPEIIKNARIYDAVMEIQDENTGEYRTDCSCIFIENDGATYYETESYIPVAIHNLYQLDMNAINRMKFNLCV